MAILFGTDPTIVKNWHWYAFRKQSVRVPNLPHLLSNIHLLAAIPKAPVSNILRYKHIVEHLPDPTMAIKEIGRVTEKDGILILATPNLGSLLKPWKGDKWIGYQDPTHIALKEPQEWLRLIQEAGFELKRVFSDGFWDVPYVRFIPSPIQKLLFGSLGGLQAISGFVFLPMRWGESVIVIARKK